MAGENQEVNKELAKSLQSARKRPRNFAAIAKGANPLDLIVSKKPIKPNEVQESKKKNGGNAAFQGVVKLDPTNDAGLVFQVLEIPSVTEMKLRKFITESTKLTLKARYEVVASIVEINDDIPDEVLEKMPLPEDNGAEIGASSKDDSEENRLKNERIQQLDEKNRPVEPTVDQQSTSQTLEPEVPNAPEFDLTPQLMEKLKALMPRIGEASGQYPQRKADLSNLVAKFQVDLRSRSFEMAKQSLRDLALLLNQLQPVKTEKKPSEVKVGLSSLNDLAGPIQKSLQDTKRGPKVKQLIADFKKAISDQNFDLAGQILSQLEGAVAPQITQTTEDWIKEMAPTLKSRSLGKKLGVGGFGAAYMLPSKEGKPLVGKFSRTMSNDHLLEKEYKIYEQLGDHPGLPKCMGVQEIEVEVDYPKRSKIKRKSLILEAVEGESQKAVLSKLKAKHLKGELSDTQYWGIIQYMERKMLQTLAHIENQGLVHSDIKPENVMIDAKSGGMKLIDLGGAIQVGETSKIVKTDYLPNDNIAVDGRFDVFSAGVVAEKSAPTVKKSSPEVKWGQEDQEQWKKIRKDDYEVQFKQFTKWLTGQSRDTRPTSIEALGHPFLSDSMMSDEEAQKLLQGIVEPPSIEVVEKPIIPELSIKAGYDREAWLSTMNDALDKGLLDERYRADVEELARLLLELDDPRANWQQFSRETDWEEMKVSLEFCRERLDEISSIVEKIYSGAPANGQVKTYLDANWNYSANVSLKLKEVQVVTLLDDVGDPAELEVDEIADKCEGIIELVKEQGSKLSGEFGELLRDREMSSDGTNFDRSLQLIMSLKMVDVMPLLARKQTLNNPGSYSSFELYDEESINRLVQECNTSTEADVSNAQTLATEWAQLDEGVEEYFSINSGVVDELEKLAVAVNEGNQEESAKLLQVVSLLIETIVNKLGEKYDYLESLSLLVGYRFYSVQAFYEAKVRLGDLLKSARLAVENIGD
ncbi:serine/threonine protein kinase [Pirellula staleyi DSM 6068]|uniref:Serine/threonine protein kinase n=1 Tax=Pirellula staleyi (strain ATCC 27377 / DSM 6068 / ICPB 4128) TaxID=530564 RepID=D2R651_PIRSD|nr:serine/threonine protein kinase [Pirellula staleyi]ADB19136.1 serine/threonine protein kinase [Pirellula staleyi DSM 6068]